MKSFMLIFSAAMLSSCIHAGMPMMHEANHPGSATESTLEKEVIVGDVKAAAMFPPLELNKETGVTLRLVNVKTSRPISGAEVYFHAEYMHKVDSHEEHASGETAHNANSSRSHRLEQEHDVHIDQDVRETADPGVYSVSYGSSQPGEHTFMFHITFVGGRKLEPEITLEAKRTIARQSDEHAGGMMGIGSSSTYLLVGTVIMGAMMAAMLLSRSGMF